METNKISLNQTLSVSSLLNNKEAANSYKKHRQVLCGLLIADLGSLQLKQINQILSQLRSLLKNCSLQPLNKFLQVPLKQLRNSLERGKELQRIWKAERHNYRKKSDFTGSNQQKVSKISCQNLNILENEQDIQDTFKYQTQNQNELIAKYQTISTQTQDTHIFSAQNQINKLLCNDDISKVINSMVPDTSRNLNNLMENVQSQVQITEYKDQKQNVVKEILYLNDLETKNVQLQNQLTEMEDQIQIKINEHQISQNALLNETKKLKSQIQYLKDNNIGLMEKLINIQVQYDQKSNESIRHYETIIEQQKNYTNKSFQKIKKCQYKNQILKLKFQKQQQKQTLNSTKDIIQKNHILEIKMFKQFQVQIFITKTCRLMQQICQINPVNVYNKQFLIKNVSKLKNYCQMLQPKHICMEIKCSLNRK